MQAKGLVTGWLGCMQGTLLLAKLSPLAAEVQGLKVAGGLPTSHKCAVAEGGRNCCIPLVACGTRWCLPGAWGSWHFCPTRHAGSCVCTLVAMGCSRTGKQLQKHCKWKTEGSKGLQARELVTNWLGHSQGAFLLAKLVPLAADAQGLELAGRLPTSPKLALAANLGNCCILLVTCSARWCLP